MAQYFTIDSSVLVSSFLSEDICFKQSQAFLRNFLNLPDSQGVMPILVCLESFKVLARVGFSKAKIQEIKSLFDLPSFRWIAMDRLFAEKILANLLDFSLKTSDAIVALTAQLYHANLITWDKRILREAKKYEISAFTPLEWMEKKG